KFLGQLAAAVILVAFGTRIDFVTNPLGGMIYVGWWGIPLTILWIVALTNSLNFIDGLDGLAAGIAAIACIPLLVIAQQRDATAVVLLTACLLGASLGFLPFNFNPARVFMGDTGAMFLGYMLAAIAVEGALKGATAIALSIPLLTLGLPVFDTACAVIRRGRHGRPIYQADAGHVHHRLLQLGLSHRQAVLVLYGVSGLLGAGALVLWRVPAGAATVGLIVVGGLLALWARRLRIFDDQPAFPEGMEG
ncbi:MAG: undecaprenyl-phosphate alpha-N-acetylglucosaminyl 1-phosphate transferase, partial [Bacillota bacterium]